MKHFEIENFRFVKNNNILVYIKRDKVAIPITIPKEKYEFWLQVSERLLTVMVLHEENKTDQMVDTKMSSEEYWGLNDEEIHEDIYSYIISQPMVFRNKTYNNSLTSINYSFNSHRATLN